MTKDNGIDASGVANGVEGHGTPALPGGFALLPPALLAVWPHLPEHHMRLLPMILSFMPNAWPAQSTLAKLVGVRREAVNATVRQMREKGLLVVRPRARGDGAATSCLYALADLDDDAVRRRVIANYTDTLVCGPTPRMARPVLNHTPLVRLGAAHPLCDPTPHTNGQLNGTREPTNEQIRREAGVGQADAGAEAPAVEAQVESDSPALSGDRPRSTADNAGSAGFAAFAAAFPITTTIGRHLALTRWDRDGLEPHAGRVLAELRRWRDGAGKASRMGAVAWLLDHAATWADQEAA